ATSRITTLGMLSLALLAGCPGAEFTAGDGGGGGAPSSSSSSSSSFSSVSASGGGQGQGGDGGAGGVHGACWTDDDCTHLLTDDAPCVKRVHCASNTCQVAEWMPYGTLVDGVQTDRDCQTVVCDGAG